MAAIAPGIEIVTSPAELGAANELENGKPTARLDKTLAVMIGVGLLPLIVPYQAAMQALGK